MMKESGVPGMSIGDKVWVHDLGHLVLRVVRCGIGFGNELSLCDCAFVSRVRRIGFLRETEFMHWRIGIVNLLPRYASVRSSGVRG